MADSQSVKKNKKKKKKPAGNPNASSDISAPLKTNNSIKEDKVSKDNPSITDILPLKVGMSAMFKDVEVTMTKCEVKSDVPASTSSKKKKKKKSKQVSEEIPKEKESANLLSFNENRIELVNHPEISVTVSKLTESKENELPKVKKADCGSVPEPKNNEENASVNTAKKKKKKKKKKQSETKAPTETKDSVTEDNSYTSPTYVKLPASGDSLVLVVSHESFSNGNRANNSSATDKGQVHQNGVNSLSEKSINNTVKENPSAVVSEMQLSNTVRIFPVPNDSGKIQQTPLDSELNSLKEDVSEDKTHLNSNEFQTATSSNVVNSENISEEGKTKAQLKAERRAKQEAQRAAKIVKNTDKESQKAPTIPEAKNLKEAIDSSANNVSVSKTETENETAKCLVEKDVIRKVRLFSHLPQCKSFKNLSDVNSKIHPAILEVGYQYSKGTICGSNARCIALLAAFSKVINGYTALSGKDFSRDLESKLQTYLNFLNNCRPLSVSMINAVKFLKHQINHVPKESDECKIKENLNSFIYNFVNDEILLAKEAIGNSASAKIVNGDIILVFSYSSLVKDVLCKAYDQDKKFQVIVVDSRPKMEGLEMLRRLVRRGLHCSYVSITALSYVMKEVSKVIIGAHALLSNGCVMSRLGCKQVALVASSYSVPVLVCCETYKFCERVLTDSFVHNELGEPEELVNSHLVPNNNLLNWKDLPSLQVLNLRYDVTPPDLISMVITEKGVLPCTSVPVVLRVRHAGLHE
ncbi:translation initiation factor eIF-2B subunit delta-like [Uloborus diversus]|uniref:translation initiation factor eIF-2B subunit delta-like n=1 Tax=Uloborus diversus TaxID=327109 RepID=UPI00240A11C4|nr:translation initiation factor eIF-2B subunit delta-like [Uloborus diversus]